MGHWHLLNSTGDRRSIERQKCATLAFLKFDMRHQNPPVKGPRIGIHMYIYMLSMVAVVFHFDRCICTYYQWKCDTG